MGSRGSRSRGATGTASGGETRPTVSTPQARADELVAMNAVQMESALQRLTGLYAVTTNPGSVVARRQNPSIRLAASEGHAQAREAAATVRAHFGSDPRIDVRTYNSRTTSGVHVTIDKGYEG